MNSRWCVDDRGVRVRSVETDTTGPRTDPGDEGADVNADTGTTGAGGDTSPGTGDTGADNGTGARPDTGTPPEALPAAAPAPVLPPRMPTADATEAADASDATGADAYGDADEARVIRPRLRAWTVSWTAGVAQTLGGALLLITEFVREDVAVLGQKVRDASQLPGYADGFPRMQASLGDHWWFRFAGDLRDAISFDEPRAALWAAVCAALVVRLNRYGPPRTQCFLSLMGALFCVVAAVSAVPYLALAGFALPFALVLAAVALVLATRFGERDTPGAPGPARQTGL